MRRAQKRTGLKAGHYLDEERTLASLGMTKCEWAAAALDDVASRWKSGI